MLTTDAAIRERKTCKLLSDRDLTVSDRAETLQQLIELAGMAPFHRPCDECHRQPEGLDGPNGLDGIEPWRFYIVEAAFCRSLKQHLPEENAGKIPAMLAAADALILATWLPNPQPGHTYSVEESSFAPTLANMEHIAATSAAVQNLLLAATARGIANYWSSGGVLRSEQAYTRLGIPLNQILLGAIFLFPGETEGAEVVGSKLREHRTPSTRWSRYVT